ncbi:MAG: hypothetical protein CL610_21135 [Anaerolineaceae bacterium]|nr:hypothetical protein [Anaerolineaceae bacterium]
MSYLNLNPISRDTGYKVVDIATPASQLTCWEAGQGHDDIVRCAIEDNLTYIPVRNEGRITGIISRKALEAGETPCNLTSDWLIATDTTILEIIELFAEQPDRVFLVLKASNIVGLVAPADLNKIPARASVYLLIAHFEAELARLIRRILPADEDYQPFLTADRWQKLQTEKANAAQKDIELDLLHHMHIYDLALIARQNDQVRELLGFETASKARRALDFQSWRNRVSHPTRPLITSRAELVKLNEACHRLIDLNQRITQASRQL